MTDKWALMVPRFCAYGFLKNLRFFEPFLVLFLRQKGLSFFEIGTLIGARELSAMVLEIPTGVVADVIGRRKAMVLSFAAYIASFLFYYAAVSFAWLLPAVLLFGAGDAFRSGTHKAMILEYLDVRGMADQRVAVYGCTRSWSQIGSALCAMLAAVLVFYKGDYGIVFLASTIPYLLDLGLITTYPRELDGAPASHLRLGGVWHFAVQSAKSCLRPGPLRVVLLNSALDKGVYKVAKDYLQPVLEATAVMLLPVMAGLRPEASQAQAVALCVGVAYVAIHLGSAWASRRAEAAERRLGGPRSALNSLLALLVVVSVLAFVGLRLGFAGVAIVAFVLLALVENARRPILVSYVGTLSQRAQRATVLSVEAQLAALVAMGVGPVMGLCADRLGVAGVFVVALVLLAGLGVPLRIREE